MNNLITCAWLATFSLVPAWLILPAIALFCAWFLCSIFPLGSQVDPKTKMRSGNPSSRHLRLGNLLMIGRAIRKY